MKARSIKIWFNLHKWTSLICTLFLLMLCITGLPLIFHEEIDHYFNNIQAADIASESPLSKDILLANGKAFYPDKVVKYVFWEKEDHPNQMLITFADSLNAPADKDYPLILDERTGKVLDAPGTEKGVMDIILYLHIEMLAGIPGKLFLGFMGLLFIVSMISGVALYGPIMKKFDFGMIRTEKSKRLKWLDTHNLLGIVVLAWAFVVGITGVINTLAEPALAKWRTDELVDMVKGYKDKPGHHGTLSSLDDALKTAKDAAPGMEVLFVAYPGTIFTSNHHYAVFMKGTTPLTSRVFKPALIDAKNGSLTDIRDLPWYLKTILISQPFHFGDYGGIPMKIIWTIFDLLTIIILITGLYLWFARRKAKAAQIARIIENEQSLSLSAVANEE
jgi:uncharacterized iron-regulated membrane protein